MAGTFNIVGNSGYRAPAQTATLQALQDRQKMADAAAMDASKMTQPVSNVAQGAAYLTNILGAQADQARTQNQSFANRSALAGVLAQVDPNKGPTQDQIAQMYVRDPEGTSKIMEMWDKHRQEMEKQTSQDVWQGGQNTQLQAAEAAKSAATDQANIQVGAGHDVASLGVSAATQAGEQKRAELQAQTTLALPGVQGAETRTSKAAEQTGETQQKQAQMDQRYAEGQKLGLKGDVLSRFAAAGDFAPFVPPDQMATAGQKKSDELAVANDADYMNSGRAQATANIKDVKTAMNLMQNAVTSGHSISGPGTGIIQSMLPDSVKPLFNPEGMTAADMMKTAVSSSLKAILGSQFTAQEGQNLMDRTFNPSQSDAENLRRAQDLLDKISAVAQSSENRHQYLMSHNQSIQGYTDAPVSYRDIKGAYGGDPNFVDPNAPPDVSGAGAGAGAAAGGGGAPREGATATGPNGQKATFTNGQWVVH
jgi:hypothetical protein